MTTVVANDPGGTCGVATGVFLPDRPPVVVAHELEPMAALDHVSAELKLGASLVVYETFRPRPGRYTWQPDALYTIGGIRYLCYLSGTPCVGQEPADAKSFATDMKLKKLGWWKPTEGGHANDALRHLLIAAVNGGLLDPEPLLR